MTSIKLEKFGGMLPAWDDRLLPEGQAALSQNGYLFSGALTGWRQPKVLRALTDPAARYVYRVPTNTQAIAVANLVFIGNPAPGTTIKVGEESYLFTATVNSPYTVLVGANATASADNLFAALTGGAGIGILFGNGTVINPEIDQNGGNARLTNDFGSGVVPYIALKAADFGAAFNSIPVTESSGGVTLKWIYDLTIAHVTTTFAGGANANFDSSITGAATWLEFQDPDTSVLRSPIVNDQFGRYYFASASLPPRYNTYDRIVASNQPFLLGVPDPGCAPLVTVTGGGDNVSVGFPNALSTNTHSLLSNQMYLTKVTPTASAVLSAISFVPQASYNPLDFQVVLYAADPNTGAATTLLNGGRVPQVFDGLTPDPTAAGTVLSIGFTNPTTLAAGTSYWIGVMSRNTINMQLADDTGTAGSVGLATFDNGFPTVVPALTAGQPDFQVWGTTSAGTAVQEARAYVYTWLTAYGEEGPPSPPTLENGWANGTWTLTLFEPPADEMGVTRNITKKRIYRTISAVGGQTTYFFVAEIDVTVNQYIDVVTDDIIALNNQLLTTLWFPPPEGLLGFVSMPNGMMAGWKANEVWFCEPYSPHAWPPGYVITTEFPIVGLGVVNNTLVICTSAKPYVAMGVNPSNMAMQKVEIPEPCTSRGSILSTDTAVFYTSLNGLIRVGQDGTATNATEPWITRERWRELTPAQYVHAIKLASSYFAFAIVTGVDSSLAQEGFTIELSAQDANSFGIWPQPGGHRLGFGQLTAPNGFDIDNVEVDPWTGIALLIQNGSVYYYDFQDQAPAMVPFKWRSKKFHQPSKKNFEAMKVYFSVPTNTPTQNPVRNTTFPQLTLASDQYGIIRVYADEVLVTTREIRSSGELLRIVSGFKAEVWQWEIEARVLISNVQVATSVKELAAK